MLKLIDVSVAFFPDVSSTFAKTMCRSLGGKKRTAPLKMIPMRIANAFFDVQILFPPLNVVSLCRFCFLSLCPGRVYLPQVHFWFLLGSPYHSERSRCYWLRITLDHCRIRQHQNSFCSNRLIEVSALLVCTSTQMWSPLQLLPILHCSWWCLRDLVLCNEIFAWLVVRL